MHLALRVTNHVQSLEEVAVNRADSLHQWFIMKCGFPNAAIDLREAISSDNQANIKKGCMEGFVVFSRASCWRRSSGIPS